MLISNLKKISFITKYLTLSLSLLFRFQIPKSPQISVIVKNIGEIHGDEIVQLYISDKYSSITRPVKELKAYQRVSLKPGESKEVIFELNKSAFAYYDSEMNYIVEAGDFDILVGNSSRDEDLKNTNFNVEKTFYITD